MTARLESTGEVTIVYLSGFLDYESSSAFRRLCLEKLLSSRVVFDLRELSFVGSSGISTFLETFKDFREGAAFLPRFSNVGTEFRRLFHSSQLMGNEFFSSEEGAINSFYQSVDPVEFPQLIDSDTSDIEDVESTDTTESH